MAAASRGNALAAAELRGPDCPAAASYIWTWFLELHARRASGGFGPSRIAWSEMDAYARLHGLRFSRWELGCIAALDRTAVTQAREAKP